MIKAIFFDFDGVLTTDRNGTGRICRNLCDALSGLDFDSVEACFRKHCKPIALGGKFADVWDDFCGCVGQKIDPSLLPQILKTVKKNEAMFAVARSLKRNYTVGIISDNEQERFDLIKEELHLENLFDPIVVSASVHAQKHDGSTTIFDVALKAAGCDASECIFIDNMERNLVTPKQMGMETYLHDQAQNDISGLVAALKQHGVTGI